MESSDTYYASVADSLGRTPQMAWIREGLALFGWGESERFELGTGVDRFDRAEQIAKARPTRTGFASFTFDDHEEGSVLTYPESLARITDAGVEMLSGSALPSSRSESSLPGLSNRTTHRDGWNVRFAQALDAITSNEVEKVVLARTVDLEFVGEVPPALVIENLAARRDGSHTFLVDGLAGSSPELLASLTDRTVKSVSLAGSASSADPDAGALLADPKSASEHGLAADSVEEALTPHCVSLIRDPRTTTAFGDITHLVTEFHGVTRPGTTVLEVLRDLHPTAAVAGTPTKKAMELIREIEGGGRGRYAGPVGWLNGRGDGEFAIALRCGLIAGSKVRLHAGAGLVAGSQVEAEYEETQLKLAPMLDALGLGD